MALKIRKGSVGRGYFTHSLGLPNVMANAIPEDARFEPEFTEDGILYRYVGLAKDFKTPTDRPAWTYDAS